MTHPAAQEAREAFLALAPYDSYDEYLEDLDVAAELEAENAWLRAAESAGFDDTERELRERSSIYFV